MRDPFKPDDTVDWDALPQGDLRRWLDNQQWGPVNHPRSSVPYPALREQRLTMLRTTDLVTAAVVGVQTLLCDVATTGNPLGRNPIAAFSSSSVSNDFLEWSPSLNNRITVRKTALYDVSGYVQVTRTPASGAFFEVFAAFNGNREPAVRHGSQLITPYNAGGVDVGRVSLTGPPIVIEAGEYVEYVAIISTAAAINLSADATRAVYNHLTIRVIGAA